MAKNPQFHGQAKDINIRHHFVRITKLDYRSTIDMTAGTMTKGLTHEQYCKLREKAGMVELH